MFRKRATLIAKDKKGILVVKHTIGHPKFMLPGGGMKKGESAIEGATRELREETGLQALRVKHLFNHKSIVHDHHVVETHTSGEPKLNWEIKKVDYVNKNNFKNANLSRTTRKILSNYFNNY